MLNNCKFLYADWCHNPKLCELDGQELCPFINEDAEKFCDYYKEKHQDK